MSPTRSPASSLQHDHAYGLAAVLVFVGGKMLLAGFYKIPTLASLLVIIGLLAVAVLASLLHAARRTAPASAPATKAQ